MAVRLNKKEQARTRPPFERRGLRGKRRERAVGRGVQAQPAVGAAGERYRLVVKTGSDASRGPVRRYRRCVREVVASRGGRWNGGTQRWNEPA